MAKNEGVELKEVTFSLFGTTAKWVADRAQIDAAWEMYVELVTRIAIQPLREQEALLREALTSLYKVIDQTRRILRHYGPAVARPAEVGAYTFAAIAVDVVNLAIRPYLTKWHPALLGHEARRPPEGDPLAHEKAWSERAAACKELESLRGKLVAYAQLLAAAADVPQEGLPENLRAS
jgi:hypothetical protein